MPVVISTLGTVTKELGKGLEELEIRTRDYPNHRTVKIGQNTEMSPGDLKRLAAIQIPVKDHQLKLV